MSPTEQEFDKAQELGLTKLVFVRGTDNSKRDAREAGKLRRIGPDKGGHWEVVGMANE